MSPRTYKKESKHSSVAIHSLLSSKLLSMSVFQVPANAVAEAQALLPIKQPLFLNLHRQAISEFDILSVWSLYCLLFCVCPLPAWKRSEFVYRSFITT